MTAISAREESPHYSHAAYGYMFVTGCVLGLVWFSVYDTVLRSKLRGPAAKILRPSRWTIIPLWIGLIVVVGLSGASLNTLNGFAKRMGRLCYASFPLILFLALRPSPLPGTYYMKLLQLHKWAARTVLLLGITHGVCYLTFFIRQDTLYKMLKLNNFLGAVILLGLLTVAVTSLRPLRRYSYKLFYITHYPLAWAMVILACFHARPGVTFLAMWCVFMLAGQIFYRFFTTRHVQVTNYTTISSTLYTVTFPRSALPEYFGAGDHVRVAGPLWSLKTWLLPTHPYTIASLSTDNEVKLVVRKTAFRIDQTRSYSLGGPFTGPAALVVAPTASKVVIFAGGSGISLAAPLARDLEVRGTPYKLIWVVREKSDVDVLSMLQISTATVYVTGTQSDAAYSDILGTGEVNETAMSERKLLDEDGIEFDELLSGMESNPAEQDGPATPSPDESDLEPKRRNGTPQSSLSSSSISVQTPRSKIALVYGRPMFSRAVSDFLGDADKGAAGVWAVACGPRQLVHDVEKWAQTYRIQFSGEKYAV